jgi:sugar lactone lactonase YvrE
MVLLPLIPGQRVYVSQLHRRIAPTVRSLVAADGTLSDLHQFAERGGESVAVDRQRQCVRGKWANLSYTIRRGKLLGEIDVPERPIDIVFGGADHRTLFILAHHALFAVRVRSSD